MRSPDLPARPMQQSSAPFSRFRKCAGKRPRSWSCRRAACRTWQAVRRAEAARFRFRNSGGPGTVRGATRRTASEARILRRWIAWLTVFAVATQLAFAPAFSQAPQVIELQYRTAEEIIPILQPLVEEGGALSGQDYTLFVRTSPANLE